MRTSLVIPTACLILAACAPVPVYYKQGGDPAQQKSDLLSCQVDALAKAPVATQIRQSPPYYIPARRYCRPDGSCDYRGGFFAPGEIHSVDVNARLRGDLEEQCMVRRGYARVEVPRCPSGTVPSPRTGASGTEGARPGAPALSAESCAVRDAAGDWRIVEPAQ